MPTEQQQQGFTLIELMIVVVIVAVLLAVALPSYQNYVLRTNRTAAQADMLAAAQAIEKLYTVNFSYEAAAAGTTFPSEGPIDATVKRYDYTFPNDPNATSYLMRATPKGPQTGDGIMEINHLGQRWWDKNNDGDVTDTDENNWARR